MILVLTREDLENWHRSLSLSEVNVWAFVLPVQNTILFSKLVVFIDRDGTQKILKDSYYEQVGITGQNILQLYFEDAEVTKNA